MASSRASKGKIDLTVNDSETKNAVEGVKNAGWVDLFTKDIFSDHPSELMLLYTDNSALKQNFRTFMLS